jgi:hypothetical protein
VRGREDALTVEDRATTKDTKEHKEALSSQQSAKTTAPSNRRHHAQAPKSENKTKNKSAPRFRSASFISALIRVNQW